VPARAMAVKNVPGMGPTTDADRRELGTVARESQAYCRSGPWCGVFPTMLQRKYYKVDRG